MANRNRSAGNGYECDEVTRHSRFFHNLKTTRACNRARDGEGIDICNDDEWQFGRLPLDIQCKSSATIPRYPRLLKEMKDGRIKVILHRYTQKSAKGKFMNKGEYVTMERRGYECLLEHLYAIQLLLEICPEDIEAIEKHYGLNLIRVPQQVKK